MRRTKVIVRWLASSQFALTMLFLHAYSSRGDACTLCHTEIGEQVRAAVFGADFLFNLAVTAIPFILFLAITALIYFGFPRCWPGVYAKGEAS